MGHKLAWKSIKYIKHSISSLFFFPCNMYAAVVHFFQKPLPIFFHVLTVADTGSCVCPQNKIGHPAGGRFPC